MTGPDSLRPLRIALVIGTLNRGGAEGQLCRLAVELHRAGHHVRVFCLSQGGPLAELLDTNGVQWKVMGLRGFPWRLTEWRRRARAGTGGQLRASIRSVRELWREFKQFEPDVCHAWLWWSYVLAVPVAALAGVPVRIIGLRGLVKKEALFLRRALALPATLLASAAIANSEAVLADHAAVSTRRVRHRWVVPNGLDLPAVQADPSREPPVGVCVANLIPYKGHSDLLEAVSAMAAPPLIRCLGEGPARGTIEQEIVRLDLPGFVRLEGSRDDPMSALLTAQFFVLPSRTEGSPNALLEAMAAGLPVVATAVGGVPDLVCDGVTGLLVPPEDPVALGAALTRLVENPALRTTLGVAARARASEFSWGRCLELHLARYRELLDG